MDRANHKVNSMEYILISQFVVSLPRVIKPQHVKEMLVTTKDIICSRARSKDLNKILLELITPLARFGVGLCTEKHLEDDFKRSLKEMCPSRAQYVMPVATIQELREILTLLKSDSLHTPPLTPTSPDEDVFCFSDTAPALDSSPTSLTDTEKSRMSTLVHSLPENTQIPGGIPTPPLSACPSPDEEGVFSLIVKDATVSSAPEMQENSSGLPSPENDNPASDNSPALEVTESCPIVLSHANHSVSETLNNTPAPNSVSDVELCHSQTLLTPTSPDIVSLRKEDVQEVNSSAIEKTSIVSSPENSLTPSTAIEGSQASPTHSSPDVFSIKTKNVTEEVSNSVPEISSLGLDLENVESTPLTPTSPYEDDVFSLLGQPVYKALVCPQALDLVKSHCNADKSVERPYVYTREQLQAYRHDQCNVEMPRIAYLLGIVRDNVNISRLQSSLWSSYWGSNYKYETSRRAFHKSFTAKDSLMSHLVRRQSADSDGYESMTYRHSGIATVKARPASLSDSTVPRYCEVDQSKYRSKNKSRADIVDQWKHDLFDPNQ